ncbi:MAG TPA: HipA family kinase [Acidobacteriaceae bacterium]
MIELRKDPLETYLSQFGNDAPPFGVRSTQTYVPHVNAVQVISRLRGGAQSRLILCDDRNLWVVKFRNNPQHLRVLANELIATRMAESIGLAVPVSGIVDVSEALIEKSPGLCVDHGPGGREDCSSGLQFGSQFVGGMMPQQVVESLLDEQLLSVRNLEQFAGILAFDKWTGNCDGRQAVYRRKGRERGYSAVFIDQGYCFNMGEWNFPDAPLKGVFARGGVYSAVTGWESFEPWLSRIEQFDPQVLWQIAEAVPPEWYGGDPLKLEILVETLLRRRSRVRELIGQFRRSDRVPFPRWKHDLFLCRVAETPSHEVVLQSLQC